MVHVKYTFWILIVALLALVSCARQEAAPADEVVVGEPGTVNAGGLDAVTRLALGTLRLERTGNAVSAEQATELLPLWQALASGALQSEAENAAIVKQIEGKMAAEQLAAIDGMGLTFEDTRAGMEEQGLAMGPPDGAPDAGAPGVQVPGALQNLSGEERTKMREQFQNVSAEERATRVAALPTEARDTQRTEGQEGAGPGVPPSGAGRQASALLGPLVELLTERSGSVNTQARALDGEDQPEASTSQETTTEAIEPEAPETEAEPASTSEQVQAEQTEVVEPETAKAETEPGSSETDVTESDDRESVSHTVRAGESLASIAPAYGVSVASIVEANQIQDANLIEIGQELVIPDPSQIPDVIGTEAQAPGAPAAVVAAPVPALEELEDTDPGPPLAIEVSANRATQDPLVEQSRQYLVTGIVRNDGDETYAVSAILATFFDAEGFRGTVDQKVRDGKVVSAEWNWHGQTEAEFAALLLAPGEQWPFSVAITAQDMASVLLHPDAVATERGSAPVALSGVQVVDDGTGYLRISGAATNVNAFEIKNVTVSGVLLDGSGQIVSLGSTYVIEEDITSGESVHFDVRVAKEPYVGYELYAQAERDWS